MIRSVLSLVLIATIAAPALAAPKKSPWEREWEKLVKKLDKDGDGQISKEEVAAAKAGHEKKAEEPKKPAEPGTKPEKKRHHVSLAKRFDEIDTNGDGKVTREEFHAFVEKAREKAAEKKAAKADEPAK